MNWNQIRDQFPATSQYTYLNAAATSPIPMPVVHALVQATHDLALRGEKVWSEWLVRVEEVRRKVAHFINAEADEIAFTQNTSTGINLLADLLGADGAMLSNTLEFPAGTLPWLHRGIPARFVKDRGGVLYPEDFVTEEALRTQNIVLSQVQFSNGCRQDLPSFAAIKRHRNLIICGSQSIGAFSFDTKRDGVDALATSGHKWLCAGFGAGFVYIKRSIIEQKTPTSIGWLSIENPFAFENQRVPPLLRENRRSELGCQSFLPIFALGAAIDFISSIGISSIEARVLALQTYLTNRLQDEGLRVISPLGAHRSGECVCVFEEPAKIAAFLREHNVLVTEKPEGIRIATHFYNNEDDVERLIYFLRGYREPALLGRPEVF